MPRIARIHQRRLWCGLVIWEPCVSSGGIFSTSIGEASTKLERVLPLLE
jgi:hypothetical protein